MAKEDMEKDAGDALLAQLLGGDWGAAGRMREQVGGRSKIGTWGPFGNEGIRSEPRGTKVDCRKDAMSSSGRVG